MHMGNMEGIQTISEADLVLSGITVLSAARQKCPAKIKRSRGEKVLSHYSNENNFFQELIQPGAVQKGASRILQNNDSRRNGPLEEKFKGKKC